MGSVCKKIPKSVAKLNFSYLGGGQQQLSSYEEGLLDCIVSHSKLAITKLA